MARVNRFFTPLLFGVVMAFSINLGAYELKTLTSPSGRYAIDLPDEWMGIEVDGNYLRYEGDGICFHIDITPFDFPMSLEKWMIDSSIDNPRVQQLTFRDVRQTAGRIVGVRMIRSVATITRNEETTDEQTYAFSCYNFVHENKGYEIKLFSQLDKMRRPEIILDEIIKTFRCLNHDN